MQARKHSSWKLIHEPRHVQAIALGASRWRKFIPKEVSAMRPGLLNASVAVFVGLAMATLFSLPSLAQNVGSNGKIVYTVNMGSPDFTTDIWVMNADGTDQTNLTNTPAVSERGPIWSPDSTRIAYVAGDNIFSSVWVMNADGTGQARLSSFAGEEFGPTWSADGTKIALVRMVPGISITSQFDIFVVALDGSSDLNITNSDFDELEPSWSPDGSRIAFAGVREGGLFVTWQIVTVNPDGTGEGDLVVMEHENRSPAWSPDSSMITFMAQFNNPCCGTWQIWAMNNDGSGQTNLSNDVTVDDMWPSWSPDGTLITFSSTRNSTCCGETNIFSMPAPAHLPLGASAGVASKADAAEPATFTQLTTNGASTDPNWGKKAPAVCKSNCLSSRGITFSVKPDHAGIELHGKVLVRDERRVLVPNALVTVKWTLPNGSTRAAQKLTDASGVADFQRNGPHGTYTLTIVNIAKQGFTFDAAKSVLSKSITK